MVWNDYRYRQLLPRMEWKAWGRNGSVKWIRKAEGDARDDRPSWSEDVIVDHFRNAPHGPCKGRYVGVRGVQHIRGSTRGK